MKKGSWSLFIKSSISLNQGSLNRVSSVFQTYMLLYVTKQLAKNVIYQPKFVKIHSVGGTKYKIDVILLGCAIFYSSDTRLHFFNATK